MEKILQKLESIASEKGFELFFYKPTEEIWMTGTYQDLKFDIYIKHQRDGKYKFIFEIPFDKKVALFLNEENLLKRLDQIFTENLYFIQNQVEVS
ncbi:hypothetical protein [Hydrogenothermus marinus]|uniref:Uncharacterized protein n=1 Tax=Hydrogenothermus marinus TaxID=133270 RepID=A0A3M0BMT8_9AQUI|nr:hypothetical protein [Hydrogenothermus marinus]RMA97579.1 hypothetical protein CLV39_0196 [Hydrogenothermus marinus]